MFDCFVDIFCSQNREKRDADGRTYDRNGRRLRAWYADGHSTQNVSYTETPEVSDNDFNWNLLLFSSFLMEY